MPNQTPLIFSFSDIDLYPENDNMIVKVNGMQIPISSLPYQHPTGILKKHLTSNLQHPFMAL